MFYRNLFYRSVQSSRKTFIMFSLEIIPCVQVQIRMPDRNSAADQDVISIVGYEDAAQAARDSIMKIVSELEERVTDTVEIDSRLHAR